MTLRRRSETGTSPKPEELLLGPGHPSPVPVDGLPDHIWPSWREALIDAQEGIQHAIDRRERVFRAAWQAGLTLAEIGEVVGLTAAGVHKITGKLRGPGDGSLLNVPPGGDGPSEGSDA